MADLVSSLILVGLPVVNRAMRGFETPAGDVVVVVRPASHRKDEPEVDVALLLAVRIMVTDHLASSCTAGI